MTPQAGTAWPHGGDIPQMSGSMANHTFETLRRGREQAPMAQDQTGTKPLTYDRVILVSVSWVNLNGQFCRHRQTITIDGQRYAASSLEAANHE